MSRIIKVLVKVYTKDSREIEGQKSCDEDAEYSFFIPKEILEEAKANGILNLESLEGGIAIPYEIISYIQTTTLSIEED